MSTVNSPEFWMAVAFVLLVVIAYNPTRKFLIAWGAKRAQTISDEIENAAALRAEAETLLEQYEGHTQNRNAEKDALILEGEQAVRVMQQEMDDALKIRIAQKQQDTADKISLMHKTVQQNLKQDILQKVVQKTTALLETSAVHETEPDVDRALEKAYQSLEAQLKRN